MTIDFYASAPQYLDHLAPTWHALPPSERGAFVVAPMPAYGVSTAGLLERAAGLGIAATEEFPAGDAPIVVAAIGNLRAVHRRGRSRVALMEHGAGQSYGGDTDAARNPSYAGGTGRLAELFLAPNAHAAARDAAAYPAAQTAVVGCPKLDDLPGPPPPGERPVIAVSVHWDCLLCAETRTGWREFRQAFVRLADRFTVLGHGHPRIIADLTREYRRFRIEVVRDFSEVLRRAHVYAVDNSSTLFEAAATGRPVVALEPSFYRRSVHHGLRFWAAADVGVRVRARHAIDSTLGRRLIEGVEEALADAPERRAAREAAVDLVYAYRSGAAARAADVIGTWAAAPAAEAVA